VTLLEKRKIRAKRLFLAPITLFLSVMTVFPLGYLLIISFTDRAATNQDTQFVGLDNYVAMFRLEQFWSSLGLTLIIAFTSVFCQLVLGFFAALSLSFARSNLWLIRTLLIIPMAAAPVAVLFNWRYMFNTSTGIVNYLLEAVGLAPVDWLNSGATALISIILVEVWTWTPFIFIILVGAISAIPEDVIEAANLDGASRSQLIWMIYFPLISPFLLIATLLRLIDALKTFDSIQVLTAGGPGYDTTTLNHLIFLDGIRFLRFAEAAASTVVLLVIITIIARVFYNRLLKLRELA
jgi:multiple sugar transport system permease protein